MKIYHSETSLLHAPEFYFRRGRRIDPLEQPERYHVLLGAALAAGHEPEAPGDHGLAPALRVHSARYLDFLANAWARRDEIEPGLDYVLPSHFARAEMHHYPDGMIGRVGFHMADLSTPLHEHSYASIRASCDVAVSTAEAAAGALGHAYGLCRPPGHHASTESAGGFCFINNSAVAAAHMGALLGKRVGIIDIDVHHGNGTQIIFYDRDDVVTVSIHADTSNYMPYYSGYAGETGTGKGAGCNLNLPQKHGIGDAPWLAALEQAIAFCEGHGIGALVVALGLDSSDKDPNGAMAVTTEGFRAAGRRLGETPWPAALIQEGGYLGPYLGANLAAFLDGFDAARA